MIGNATFMAFQDSDCISQVHKKQTATDHNTKKYINTNSCLFLQSKYNIHLTHLARDYIV